VTGDEHGEPSAREALFRTIQEALNNAAKHAGVAEGAVALDFGADAIEATIRDAGSGFDPGALSGGQGFGLTTMRERIESAGKTFTLTSTRGEGTEIVARVPISPGGPAHGQEP